MCFHWVTGRKFDIKSKRLPFFGGLFAYVKIISQKSLDLWQIIVYNHFIQ